MSDITVFIFDEIFESMFSAQQLLALRNLDVELHIISKKCKISNCTALNNSTSKKILCINPDFVDWSFTAQDCKNISGIEIIISSSDNISWLDLEYAKTHGIRYEVLENLITEYNAVAEYAITIMLSLARNIPLLQRNQYPLDYGHDFVDYRGLDITGKTAGIIGLGNIGSAIAKRCKGLGMQVVYWSRNEKPKEKYKYLEINELLASSDVVFPTLQPNDETKLLLPNKRLELIKTEAIVVSVVNGLIDSDYLAEHTAQNKLFGFGFGADPNSFSHYRGNVWAVPDYAWATKINMQTSYDQFLKKIINAVGRLI
jgi:phosphoglycerate dehydrogenase-like enzyme